MFLKKEFRDTDNEIISSYASNGVTENSAVVNVRVENEGQIFSSFNYDTNDTLNSDLADYLTDKAKHTVVTEELTVKIYTDKNVSAEEVSKAIKSHFGREYVSAKEEMRRTTVFSFVMLIIGIISLTLQLTLHAAFNNEYINIITEIATWVFVWEAVDSYFLQRMSVKQKCRRIQQLFKSKIQVIKTI